MIKEFELLMKVFNIPVENPCGKLNIKGKQSTFQHIFSTYHSC